MLPRRARVCHWQRPKLVYHLWPRHSQSRNEPETLAQSLPAGGGARCKRRAGIVKPGMAGSMIQPVAVIFDLDGVLADTVEFHYRAWKHIADKLDVPFGPEDMNRLRGRQRRDCLLDLLNGRPVDEAEITRLMTLKEEFYMADLEQMTPASLLPGVLDFVLAAKKSRLRLGVASASMTARAVLQKTGLLAYMDAVADGSTVSRSKPAPDIF